MIQQKGMEKIASFLENKLDHAIVHSGGTQTQVSFYQRMNHGKAIEIWIKIPDQIERIDKIQIIDTDGDVFLEKSKVITRRRGRVLVEVFNLEVKEVPS